MGEATVWMQSLGEQWERAGADRARGVWPEALRATANDWGSDTASFLLRRDPGAVFPDLLPFTPVDIEVGGERCWSGFVWEPPQQADERAMAVECRGWPYHADDDLVDRFYVHSRLESWIDLRSSLTETLGSAAMNADAQVALDQTITLMFPAGVALVVNDRVGVLLDLGPNNSAARIVVEYEQSNNDGSARLEVLLADEPNSFGLAAGQFDSAFTANLSGGQTGFLRLNSTTSRRYAMVYIHTTAGHTPGTDVWARLRSIQVFAATAYESGDASILKVSDIEKDLLPLCPLLDQRTDLIQSSTVNLPEFVMEDRTPRQGMEQANEVEGRQQRVTPERLLEGRPRPTVPLLKTGAWAPGALSGASRGTGEPIHNRVIVKGNDLFGGHVQVERYTAHQPDAGAFSEAVGSPSFPNPSFATDASGWSNVTRDTGVFDSSPASGRLTASAVASTTLSGTFERLLYRIVGAVSTGGTFDPFVLAWVPPAPATGVTFTALTSSDGVFVSVGTATSRVTAQLVTAPQGGVPWTAYIDTLAVQVVRRSIPDRRGFIRARGIQVQRALSLAMAEKIADVSIKDGLRTAFKGDLAVRPGTVRTFLGDAPVHPAQLLRHTGEVLHHAGLVDPDTGALGRDARVLAVAYDDDAVASTVTLDNTRTDFETQLARYEVTGRR